MASCERGSANAAAHKWMLQSHHAERRKPMIAIKRPINIVAAFGLGLGAVFGMAGAFVTQPNVQGLLWAIDGAGLTMATALLAIKYFGTGHDLVAAGFMVFAVAEAVMMSGTAAGLTASVPSFAAGAALWRNRAFAHQHSKTFCPAGSPLGLGERDPLCRHRGKDLLGRAIAPNLGAFAFLRLPRPRHDFGWLDLEPGARRRVAFLQMPVFGAAI